MLIAHGEDDTNVPVAAAAAIAFGLHQPNADWMPVSAMAAMKPVKGRVSGDRLVRYPKR